MSKERLKEIETKYSTLTVSSERDGIEYTEIDVKDLVFLIQNGFKQAERVEELKEERDEWKDAAQSYYMINQELREQNKRYREALEFYANEETYETKFATDTDEIFDPFTLIELDEGKKARKALEGEEE